MSSRIILFGATGYTGRRTLDELIALGAEPVLAARSQSKLDELVGEIGRDLPTAVADVADPASVRALVEAGDVLLTTVGPFARWGEPAVAAALDAGAHYIDSTGEPGFVRGLFEGRHQAARDAGIAMLPAMGYDYVPGNLAGALAARDAGDRATRIEIGYFLTGKRGGPGDMSGGTRSSLAGVVVDDVFTRRGGRIVTERAAKRVLRFEFGGKRHNSFSIGTSETYSLPRVYPNLLDVDVGLGWMDPASRVIQVASAIGSVANRFGPIERAMRAGTRRVKGSTGGPSTERLEQSGSHIAARALDGSGNILAEAHLDGINGYIFTFRMLAWSAVAIAGGKLQANGVIGPVEAFGLDTLAEASAGIGLPRV